MKKPLLVFETSGRTAGAALREADGRTAARTVEGRARHGAALIPLADELLRARGLTPRELGGIGVSLGPGSWTGLRVGLAAAKAVAWSCGLELVGVPSFEALAAAAFSSPSLEEKDAPPALVLTLRTAYSSGVYAALFRKAAPTTTKFGEGEGNEKAAEFALPGRVWEDGVFTEEELLAALEEEQLLKAGAAVSGTATRPEPLPSLAVVGDAVCVESERFTAWAAARPWCEKRVLPEISPEATAACAWARYAAGRTWRTEAEIHRAAPLYLRRSDPELKQLKSKDAAP